MKVRVSSVRAAGVHVCGLYVPVEGVSLDLDSDTVARLDGEADVRVQLEPPPPRKNRPPAAKRAGQ